MIHINILNNSTNYLNSNDIPMGLGMALAQNPEAMAHFATLSKEMQLSIIYNTQNIHSKQEMKNYVNNMFKTI